MKSGGGRIGLDKFGWCTMQPEWNRISNDEVRWSGWIQDDFGWIQDNVR
jgi:hypothetical protein